MPAMRVSRTRRTGLVLCVAFLACLTIPLSTDAYLFGSTSNTRAVSADDAVIRESGSAFSVATPSTTAARSTSLSRPHTADEDVEAAEAALATNTTPTSPSVTTSTSTTSPPRTSAPKATTATPNSSSSAATPQPTTTKSTKSTPSSSPSSGSVSIDAEGLSDEKSTTVARGSEESSLDKTVVLAIVGIVGAVGVTTLLVSRQIKKTFSPEDDDEWHA